MTATLTKVPGGYRVVIPDELAARAGFADGCEVVLSAEAGRLVAEGPAGRPPEHRLEDLLAGITPENRHGEFDWGPPVGKERFWEAE